MAAQGVVRGLLRLQEGSWVIVLVLGLRIKD